MTTLSDHKAIDPHRSLVRGSPGNMDWYKIENRQSSPKRHIDISRSLDESQLQISGLKSENLYGVRSHNSNSNNIPLQNGIPLDGPVRRTMYPRSDEPITNSPQISPHRKFDTNSNETLSEYTAKSRADSNAYEPLSSTYARQHLSPLSQLSPRSRTDSENGSEDRQSPSPPKMKKGNDGSPKEPESLDEMERQNEIFRATYYEGRRKSRSKQIRVDPPRVDPVTEVEKCYPGERRSSSSSSHIILRTHSPEDSYMPPIRPTSSPDYEVHGPRSRYLPERGPAHVSAVNSRDMGQGLPQTVISNEIKIVHSNYSNRPPYEDHRSRNQENIVEHSLKRPLPPIVHEEPLSIRYRSHRGAPFYHHHAPRLITTDTYLIDTEMDKYNSDFYTKLPPKLHIVESQSENGVTLTWNSTSNTDCSLVKSYHLFARELFGYKVGTMKRMGIVDALPLPMSCNIDKLKPNVKYKFAVCAVDVYGRFGKMSNFTGKFELKQKKEVGTDQTIAENKLVSTDETSDDPKVSIHINEVTIIKKESVEE